MNAAPTGDGGAGLLESLTELIQKLRSDMDTKFEEADQRIDSGLKELKTKVYQLVQKTDKTNYSLDELIDEFNKFKLGQEEFRIDKKIIDDNQ